MINRLEIVISPCPVANDHQARPFVDDRDWLGLDDLGLDPPDLRIELAREDGAQVLVGRCGCGCLGCGDVAVDVRRGSDTVEWHRHGSPVLRFDMGQYDREIARFAADHSWETVGRRVEREVGAIFANVIIEGRLTFDWASTRIQDGLVHLSFSLEGEQRLLDFPWDTQSVESAVARAHIYFRERCEDG